MVVRNLIPISILILLISCNGSIEVIGLKDKEKTPEKIINTRFAMSTAESSLTLFPEKYHVVSTINLYDLVPHLDQLPITEDSFIEVMDVLEAEANRENANRAFLIRTGDCNAPIGYCQAKLANKVN